MYLYKEWYHPKLQNHFDSLLQRSKLSLHRNCILFNPAVLMINYQGGSGRDEAAIFYKSVRWPCFFLWRCGLWLTFGKKRQIIYTLLLSYFRKILPLFIKDIDACIFIKTHILPPKIQYTTSIIFDSRALKCKGEHWSQWDKTPYNRELGGSLESHYSGQHTQA